MMETITITLSRKMPIARRVSETGDRLREWVRDLQIHFNAERDKLQFEKWELKNAQYHYHYLILRGKELSAGKINIKHTELNAEPPGPLTMARSVDTPSNGIPLESEGMVGDTALTGDEV